MFALNIILTGKKVFFSFNDTFENEKRNLTKQVTVGKEKERIHAYKPS